MEKTDLGIFDKFTSREELEYYIKGNLRFLAKIWGNDWVNKESKSWADRYQELPLVADLDLATLKTMPHIILKVYESMFDQAKKEIDLLKKSMYTVSQPTVPLPNKKRTNYAYRKEDETKRRKSQDRESKGNDRQRIKVGDIWTMFSE